MDAIPVHGQFFPLNVKWSNFVLTFLVLKNKQKTDSNHPEESSAHADGTSTIPEQRIVQLPKETLTRPKSDESKGLTNGFFF